jgi:hypothetical protein
MELRSSTSPLGFCGAATRLAVALATFLASVFAMTNEQTAQEYGLYGLSPAAQEIKLGRWALAAMRFEPLSWE